VFSVIFSELRPEPGPQGVSEVAEIEANGYKNRDALKTPVLIREAISKG
jgi:hypothetical protein